MSHLIINPNQAAPEGTRRKIDIDIATRLFGHKVAVHTIALGFTNTFWTDEPEAEPGYEVPHFDSNDRAARLVKDKLKQMGYLVIVKEMPDGQYFRTNDTGADLPGVSVAVELMPIRVNPDLRKWGTITATGDDPCEVMCRAALRVCDATDIDAES